MEKIKKIRILIASPSDVAEERAAAQKVIGLWNVRHADEGLSLEAVLWESHAAPESGERTQGILNRQIVDRCDFAIGIFWTRIGTHTGVAPGGAVEEIERLEKQGKKIMLYFSKMSMPRYGLDFDQVKKVDEFRESIEKKGYLFWEYNDLHEFEQWLTHHLDMQIRRWFCGSDSVSQKLLYCHNNKSDQQYQSILTEELGKIRLLGSPDIDSVQVRLDDTFVPLRISHTWKSDDRFKGKRAEAAMQEEMRPHTPDELMQQVFPAYRMLLVIGDPGAGKTTLLKYYALCCLQQKQDRLFGNAVSPVRVLYLPLRELKVDESGNYRTLPEQFSLWSKARSNDIGTEVFEEWLRNSDNSKSLVLFDGLDEISDLELRKAA